MKPVLSPQKSEPKLLVAFLIDADNLPASAIDRAFEHFEQAGAFVSIRRAFGGFEKLSGLKEVLRRHAIQASVNQGKGTTDVALVVNAMDLLHQGALPSAVAIGSSDADFAPLAVRLREAGKLVICFAQKLISSDALPLAYDKVIYVDEEAVIGLEKPGAVRHRDAIAKTVEVAEELPEKSKLKQVSPQPQAQIKKDAGPIVGSTISVGDMEEVRRILAVFPDWMPDTIRQLNQLGAPLHANSFKKGKKPLHELFRKHPAYFKVLPTTGPAKQIRLMKRP